MSWIAHRVEVSAGDAAPIPPGTSRSRRRTPCRSSSAELPYSLPLGTTTGSADGQPRELHIDQASRLPITPVRRK